MILIMKSENINDSGEGIDFEKVRRVGVKRG